MTELAGVWGAKMRLDLKGQNRQVFKLGGNTAGWDLSEVSDHHHQRPSEGQVGHQARWLLK